MLRKRPNRLELAQTTDLFPGVSHLLRPAALCLSGIPSIRAKMSPVASTLSVPLLMSVLARPVVRARIEPSDSDGALVERARQGDRWAEEALYRRHARAVMRVSLRLLRRTAEAEDVVQDSFIIAFDGIGRLRDGNAFGDWLLSIAVRLVYRRFRRWRIMRALGLERGQDDAGLDNQADTGASPEQRAALAEIGRLLDSLRAEDRVAWVLRRIEGEQIDRIATACGCSRATTKRRIARADDAIHAYVIPQPEDDDE
jgi:RNA polymerase sigma-70 factor, ECF subfamily